MKLAEQTYISIHIYYNVIDLRPVLLECVDPLVERLTVEGLISSYFFIRYWEGGAHVRLRLLPSTGADHAEIRSIVDGAVGAFLEQRPSLFDPDPQIMAPLMRAMFVAEYGQEEYVRQFGADGMIPIMDNNSFRYMPYFPEYGRYGGASGIALAEEHFHLSSVIALELIGESNSHVRTSILGLAFQLMLYFVYSFFEDKAVVAGFFKRYAEFFSGVNVTQQSQDAFEADFERQSDRILSQVSQVEQIHRHLQVEDGGALSRYSRNASHMRDRIRELHGAGELLLEPPTDSYESACSRLLTSYVHMMNNRLGILIREEVYMANMIHRTLGGAL
ncbi:thiopeptide-type bacteriocin biosynthesis protein [Massilia antarctica]|uniref:Thiopeptide-type bacteriocin biosynthesis protein n=1 Tax=Massilia antarctica TaxID=2765360 RepID=A0AA49A6T8_9BURK|nr:thiopeptide-type bacteriocin biosynthesis protein [Massilia antarctica]QPI48753.1 thiopeptide-type bacteriocin biosynthesis protein [Massilia antarctica]